MPGGRARSARSDISDSDDAVGEKELELVRLQRQQRIMEKDRKAYVQESKDRIMAQRKEIKVLVDERQEIVTDMSLIDSRNNQNKNKKNQDILGDQAKEKLSVEEEIENEKKNHDELKAEIRIWERKNSEQNKKMGGVYMSAQHQQHISKKTLKMENQLQLANNTFSKRLENNRALREEIDSLRVERKKFDDLYKKLDKELQELKQEIGEVIDQSTAAYDSRDEAQTKMIILKEKSDKDIQSHNAEMKELLRIIEHDRKMREFMMCKGKERPEDPQLVMWRQKKEAIEAEKKRASQTDSVESYLAAYERIKEITGEEDMDLIVDTFIREQDRNFALFTLVNEQNNQVELLQDQIQAISSEIEDFQAQGVQLEAEREQILQRLEEKQGSATKAANEYDEKHKGVMKILDQLRAGIDSLFNKIGGDKDAIDDMLGTNVGVTDQNMLQYLGLVENKTNELLLMQAFLQSQKDDDYTRKPQSLLGQGPQPITAQQSTMKIAPPAVGDDYDSDASDVSDDNAQPFTKDQLMTKAMRSVLKQESAAKKEGFRYDLSEAANKGKKKDKTKK